MGPVRSFRCPHRPRRLTRNEPAETALFRRRTTSSPDTRTEVHPLPGFSLLPRRASAATSPVEMFPAETQRRFRPAGTPPSSPASAPSCRDSPPPGFLRGSSSCTPPPGAARAKPAPTASTSPTARTSTTRSKAIRTSATGGIPLPAQMVPWRGADFRARAIRLDSFSRRFRFPTGRSARSGSNPTEILSGWLRGSPGRRSGPRWRLRSSGAPPAAATGACSRANGKLSRGQRSTSRSCSTPLPANMAGS